MKEKLKMLKKKNTNNCLKIFNPNWKKHILCYKIIKRQRTNNKKNKQKTKVLKKIKNDDYFLHRNEINFKYNI